LILYLKTFSRNTYLTDIGFDPSGGFLPICRHIPTDDHAVLTSRQEQAFDTRVAQCRYFITERENFFFFFFSERFESNLSNISDQPKFLKEFFACALTGVPEVHKRCLDDLQCPKRWCFDQNYQKTTIVSPSPMPTCGYFPCAPLM